MLLRKFKKTDWEIIEAENGKIAVELAFEHQPDLILMDMHMPVMDGHEATRYLRKEGYKGKITALSASVMQNENQRAIEDGCDFFISKPINRDFIATLSEMLEK